MSNAARWFIGIMVGILIAGLIGYAKGRPHHRGDEVGKGSIVVVVQTP